MGKKSTAKGFSKFFLSFSVFVWFVEGVNGENVLFLLPLSTNSHKIFFQPLINALAEKGHNVTVLTNERSANREVHLVKEIVAIPNEDYIKVYPDPFEILKNGNRKMAFPFHFILEGCHKVIQSQAFRGIMRQKNIDFDLIFVDSFLSGCLSGFIYKSGAPFISVTTMPAPSYIAEKFGNFLPPSIIPVLSFRGYEGPNAEMGFLARLCNFVHFVLARFYVNLAVLPSLENVYRQYLGEDIPGIAEIESKASMLFMNSHYSMNFPRPLTPSVIEIGGMHCRNGTGLNSHPELEEFISTAASPHGFIYFSVGSIIDLNNAPEEFLHSLMATFAKLDQRVVLKWKRKRGNSTKNPLKIPNNVWIGDWFSQQDILGHENIRLFISHGGLLSIQESVYHGVSVLGIPFGIDQHTNILSAVLQGFALQLDLDNVNEETLTASIDEMLSDSRYHENVQRISKIFRQRQTSPLEAALYWTEYVMTAHKENTTDFLQSPARNLSYFQYYSYDIFLFLITNLIITMITLAYLVREGARRATQNLTFNLIRKAKIITNCETRNEGDKKLN